MLIMGLVVMDPRKHIVFTFHPYTVSTAERSPLWIVHVYIHLCDAEGPVPGPVSAGLNQSQLVWCKFLGHFTGMKSFSISHDHPHWA